MVYPLKSSSFTLYSNYNNFNSKLSFYSNVSKSKNNNSLDIYLFL